MERKTRGNNRENGGIKSGNGGNDNNIDHSNMAVRTLLELELG